MKIHISSSKNEEINNFGFFPGIFLHLKSLIKCE